MASLAQMELFYFVATWNSFTRAAEELGVSKGYVSSQITALEKKLNVKLIQRTTRNLSLTEEGYLFFESCTKIVQEKQLAFSLLKETQDEPAGQLRITAPLSFCETVLAELVPKFQQKFPKISLAIDASSSVKNLLQHNIDLALRITTEPDENYIARIIANFRYVICATPNYLKQYASLKKPNDLLQHNCLIYSSTPEQNHWPIQIGKAIKFISVHGNLSSGNSAIIKKALLAHQGIARLPQYLLTKEIAEQKIQILLEENTRMETPIYAIYASGKVPKKINCFIDFFKEKLLCD